MLRELQLVPNKTYATHANAVAAVNKVYGAYAERELRFFITCNAQGRYFPVFLGEAAVQAHVHFHFNVVG